MVKGLVVARRGLTKFFDIRNIHISRISDKVGGSDWKNVSANVRQEYNIAIEPCLQALAQGKQIIIY